MVDGANAEQPELGDFSAPGAAIITEELHLNLGAPGGNRSPIGGHEGGKVRERC